MPDRWWSAIKIEANDPDGLFKSAVMAALTHLDDCLDTTKKGVAEVKEEVKALSIWKVTREARELGIADAEVNMDRRIAPVRRVLLDILKYGAVAGAGLLGPRVLELIKVM